MRWGVYVVFEAPSDYARRCFKEYGLATDSGGRYAAMYKTYHLIGLELGISVAHAALHGETTGNARGWREVVGEHAKRQQEERRGGRECASPWRSRGDPDP